MSRIRTALTQYRETQQGARDRRAVRQAIAAAPTLESRHEIEALTARR